ncbi:MAG: FAD-dependent thymidylate synthase [Planctomycetes bacterium]|nr:FAD-dependent thymidylate synthase [Planctomycetota bacterium]
MSEEQTYGDVEKPHEEKIERVTVPALDPLLGRPFKVLDDGFVRVVDYLGGDESIVQAARVSYGRGTRKVHEDRGLIRYLMRHRHTTPFEMCEIKFHVRAPMDAWRQWIRHRTACLAEGTEVYFDLPGGIQRRGNQLYKVKIEDLWRKFQPTRNLSDPRRQRNPFFKANRVAGMRLRQIDEQTRRLQHTRIATVYKNGRKPVFRMTLADGKTIECTRDHRFFFSDGWHTLAERVGLDCSAGGVAHWTGGETFLYVNGCRAEAPAPYRDAAWLDHHYNVEKVKIQDVADRCGVTYHTIRKWLILHGLTHQKGGRSQPPWNRGRSYRLGPRRPSIAWKEANRRARSGAASNFWRGGIATQRSSIGRWTTQHAHIIHELNRWTCQLCHHRAPELHCHHIVPVWADASRAWEESNLTTLCGDCHRSIQGRELDFVERLGGPPVREEWKARSLRTPRRWLEEAKLVRVEGFEFVGEKETYDLEVEGPFHNFVANGIVTHNSVNEYSTRYSIAIDSAQKTPSGKWRMQAAGNRQGSEGYAEASLGGTLTAREEELQRLAREVYNERIGKGIAREQARKDLPLSTYTEAYWKVDLWNLLHFLSLRMDPHAQEEIRDYATTMGEKIVAVWVPHVWQAFLDYNFRAVHLSCLEADLLAHFLAGRTDEATKQAASFGWLEWDDKKEKWKRNRERQEFEEKMSERFGFEIRWKRK